MHLGIDFGTCFTSAAVLTGNQFGLVRDSGGGNAQLAYPSAVCLTPEGELLLGTLARNTARRYPDRFRHEFKRELGSNTPFYLGDTPFLPQDLIARLLARLKEEAERSQDVVMRAAVLTVPASYDAYRRDLMLQAGVAAGFREDGVVLLEEPEAAAIYYDWQLKQKGKPLPEGAILLVYDLGGGTFDAALMRKEGDKFRSLAPAVGDPHCGGIDFDRVIYEAILSIATPELQEMLASENVSIPARRVKLQIADFCRDAKHQLTERQRVEDVLPGPGAEHFVMTQATFNQKIAPFVDRTIELCNELVSSSGHSWDKVDGILLVGGSSRIPYIGTRLSDAFYRPLWQVEDPQLAVCMGAAIRSGYRRDLKAVSLVRIARTNPVLVSGNGDGTIQFWDTSNGNLVRTLNGHTNNVIAIAFSPDGKLFASKGGDKTIKIWSYPAGELSRTIGPLSDYITSLAFSPDGKIMATGNKNSSIHFFDTSTGGLYRSPLGVSHYVTSMAFSPDGTTLASGHSRIVQLWDATNAVLLRTLVASNGTVYCVAFNPHGKMLASGGMDLHINLWDYTTGQLLRTLGGVSDYVNSVAFSPDGKTLASGNRSGVVHLFDTATGALLRMCSGHSGEISSIAFSPDGKVVASGSADKTIKLWDAKSGELLRTITEKFIGSMAFILENAPGIDSTWGHSGRVRALAGRADWWVFATGSDDKTIKLWDTTTGNLSRSLGGENGKIVTLAFSHDGTTLITNDNGFGFWDIAAGKRAHPRFGPRSGINSIATSLDGKLIATVNDDAILCLWDAIRREPLHAFIGHTARICTAAFSPDCQLVVTGSEDSTIRFWSVTQHKLLATLIGHEGDVRSVAISPDGKTLASSGSDHKVRLWDMALQRQIHLLIGHTDAVNSVGFSEDGSTLVSAGTDKTIRLWNVATGDLLDTLSGHEESINAALFARNDTRIVSVSDDRSVRFWQLEWA